MTGVPRLRRHTDGRIALAFCDDKETHSSAWMLFCPEADGFPSLCVRVDVDSVSGAGWHELFVARLPEPDDYVTSVGIDGSDVQTPTWKMSHGESVTSWIEGVETAIWELTENLDSVRSDGLKILAAVAMCESYRIRPGAIPAPMPATRQYRTPRFRRHTDGRVAVSMLKSDSWFVDGYVVTDADVSTDGWDELSIVHAHPVMPFDEADPMTWGNIDNEGLPEGYEWRQVKPVSGIGASYDLFAPDGRNLGEIYRNRGQVTG